MIEALRRFYFCAGADGGRRKRLVAQKLGLTAGDILTIVEVLLEEVSGQFGLLDLVSGQLPVASSQ